MCGVKGHTTHSLEGEANVTACTALHVYTSIGCHSKLFQETLCHYIDLLVIQITMHHNRYRSHTCNVKMVLALRMSLDGD